MSEVMPFSSRRFARFSVGNYMRSNRSVALAFVLAMLLTLLMMLGGCEKQPPTPKTDQGPLRNPVTAPVAARPPSASTTISVPNVAALAKQHGPAVVNISIERRVKGPGTLPEFPDLAPGDPLYEFLRQFGRDGQSGMSGRPRQELHSQSLGSGFLIDKDGHVLTNAHVVEGADQVTVALTDEREFKARLVGIDKRSDLALLKIAAKDLPFVVIGDASKLEVGEWVVAIGAPFGFVNSVTQGIVSAKGRALPGENIVPFIQTDAAINPGNSGGPLFNMNGEVVGINSQIYSRSGGSMGISFAIPIDVAMKIKDQLLKHGSVKRGKMGVIVQNLTPELAETFGLGKPVGALIASVEKVGPAERAGLQSGDIVIEFDGTPLPTAADLSRAVAGAAPGAKARLKVLRDGAPRDLVVKLDDADVSAPRKEAKPRRVETDRIGLSMRELTGNERQEAETEGAVVVEAVQGLAAASGIQSGDIVLSINNKPIANIRQLRTVLGKASARVALLIQRGPSARIFISLNLQNG